MSVVQPLCVLDSADPVGVRLSPENETADAELVEDATGSSGYGTPGRRSRNYRNGIHLRQISLILKTFAFVLTKNVWRSVHITLQKGTEIQSARSWSEILHITGC